ncbi:glutaredoxin family protein [Neobacillus piezotolerans]|uniref:Glutaredoxin family protein n=1 Tax=Neobacillus piezotolerans TaxID=2259171 RepID=A0A3D8GU07_9BACI|nr:glutaredoxin family protein [Neobacillus piezotolerans]RDU37689.1 glutaredoxin family protein [Neobacillus piezotolerans]
MKSKVTFYTRSRCPLCDKAKADLLEIREAISFELEEIDIASSDKLTEEYGLMIPVILVDGIEAGYGIIDKQYLYSFIKEKQSNHIS